MNGSPDIVATLLAQNTPVTFVARGPSMNPVIPDGSTVRIRPVSPEAIAIGDVILHRLHGRLALHRCVDCDRQNNLLAVAADAALDGVEWIPAGDVLGVAEWVLRNGQEVRLDNRRARWGGLLHHRLRPLRRVAVGIYRLFRR